MPDTLRWRKDESGQAQIEFALTIFTILFVVFMTIELCSAVYTYVVLSDAVNEGLRYAIVHSSDKSNTNTINVVKKYAANSLHDTSGMTVTTGASSWSAGDTITVSASYPYLPYLRFMTAPPTMHAYAEGTCVY